MERRQARYGLMSALLALILAVFVLIPTADAATCAIEAEASHSAALTLEDAGDEPVMRPVRTGTATTAGRPCHRRPSTRPPIRSPL